MSENRIRTRGGGDTWQLDFFRDVMTLSRECFWEVDGEFAFTFCSEWGRAVLGYDPGDMVGRSPVEFEEDAQGLRNLRAVFHSRKPFWDLKCSWRAKNGQTIRFLTNGTPVYGSGGEFQGYRGVSRGFSRGKWNETALRESEERLRVLFESTPIPYHALDGTGCILQANRAWLTSFGYEYDEVAGRWFGDFLAPEERGLFLVRLSNLKESGNEQNVEYTMRRKDGSTVIVSVSGQAEYYPDGSFRQSYCVLRDITEHKRTERALEIQHDLAIDLAAADDIPQTLSCIMEAALRFEELDCGGIYLAERGGGITLAMTRGLSPEFVERVRHFDRDTPNVRAAVRGEPVYSHFSMYPTPKDEIGAREGLRALAVVPVHRQGEMLAVLNLASHTRDEIAPQTRVALTALAHRLGGILARIRAEDEMRLNEEKYQSLFESIPNPAFLIDRRTGRMLDVNPSALMTYGYERDEFLNLRITDISAEPEATARALMDGEARIPLRLHKRKDGGVFPVEISMDTFETRGGTVVLGIARDITVRNRMEAALRESVAEKETLLRELHHRVKNNLSAIIGLMDLQIASTADEAVTPVLAMLRGRIRSMLLIHERLYRAENLSRIDFQDYLTALASSIRISWGNRNEIGIDVQARGVEIALNSALPCGMIVNELVTNALKYAFPGGVSGDGREPCRIVVTMTGVDGAYTLIVADNGRGLPADIQLNEAETLGLRLVRMLVEHQLGGTIAVDRTGGTRFTIAFTSWEKD